MIPLVLASLIMLGCTGSSAPSYQSDEQLRKSLQNALETQDHDTALPILETLIERNLDEFDLLASRATVHMLMGHGELAKPDFSRCIAIDKEKGEKLKLFVADRVVWKARELSASNDDVGAVTLLDAVIILFPNSGMAYHDRGGAKLDLEDFDGAVEDLTLAIKHDQGNNRAGDSYTLRARAFRGLGDKEAAATDESLALEQLDQALIQ